MAWEKRRNSLIDVIRLISNNQEMQRQDQGGGTLGRNMGNASAGFFFFQCLGLLSSEFIFLSLVMDFVISSRNRIHNALVITSVNV